MTLKLLILHSSGSLRVGEQLLNRLREFKITQDEFAKRAGISRLSVNEIINGKRNLTAPMAVRIAYLFGETPEDWMQLQVAEDLAQAKRKYQKQIAALRPL